MASHNELTAYVEAPITEPAWQTINIQAQS